MEFRSIHEHGFARVAACTGRTAIGDPLANAEAILAMAQRCSDDGVDVAVFTELGLSGYSIEDLLLQDALLDAVDTRARARRRWPAATSSRCSSSAPRSGTTADCSTAPSSCTAASCSASRRSPTSRTTASSTSDGRSRPATTVAAGASAIGAAEVPFGPDLLFEATDLPGLVLHAEICEDMWVPIPPSAEAALAGATVLANLSGSPITVGRAEDRALLARSASARCVAAYVYAAAGRGESTTDLAWDGQTLIYENGALLAAEDRFPDEDRIAIADVDLDLLRQERMRMGSFDDNRRTHADRVGAFRRVRFALQPVLTDIGLRRDRRALPVRARRPGPARAGLLRGLQHPGRRPRAASGGDRAPQGRHRRLRGPRLHPGAPRRRAGDGPHRPAAHRHPRVLAAGLRHRATRRAATRSR